MFFNLILLFLFFVLIGVIPVWQHSSHWGYVPSGGISLLLVILIFLMATKRI